jgi:NADH-quinone oxidoreductase subunit G
VATLLDAPDQARLRAAFRNLDAVKASLRGSAPVDRDAFNRLTAALSGAASVTLLAGTDLFRSPDAGTALRTLHGLAQVLRALGKATALQLLFDRPNQLGAWDLGVLPAALPGLRPVGDAAARSALEAAWGAAIPDEPGAGLDRMLGLAAAGRLGVLYFAGADPLLSYPDRALAQRALVATDLVIVQDAWLTDSVGMAHVVLPAASYGEESGTFVNNEGRAQRVSRFRAPAFGARPNLDIFSFVAALRGRTLDADAGAVFDEIARLVPSYSRLTLDGLDDGAFTSSRSQPSDGDLIAPPSPEPVTPDGLVLVTGNCLFHSGYLTERSEIIQSIAEEPFAEMSPQDAEALGLRARDMVDVRSPRGALTARLKLTPRFPRGMVFVPENYRVLRLNTLMATGEYPCPVDVRKARAAVEPASAAAHSATPA